MNNNRANIGELFAHAKEYTIGKHLPPEQQKKMDIHPLSIDNMNLADTSEDDTFEQQMEKTTKLLAVSLDIDEADVGKISLEYLEDLIKAIFEANNLNSEKADESMKEFIEKKRKLLEEKKTGQ